MPKLVGYAAIMLVVFLLVWQTAAEIPALPRGLSAAMLAAFSLLAGIRVGTDFLTAYVTDLQRLNRTLAAQQLELEQLNARLLQEKRAAAEAPEASAESQQS